MEESGRAAGPRSGARAFLVLLTAAALATLAAAAGWALPPAGDAQSSAAAQADPGLPQDPGPPALPPPTPAPGDPPAAATGSLAIGITEPNPALLWPAGAADVPPPFDAWRDEVTAIRPAYYRLQLDWSRLQPEEDSPLHADRMEPGCMRARLPCAPWRGLREQLDALAARQAGGGWVGVVAISGTPDWAAAPARGCERPMTRSASRRPLATALPAYRRLVSEVLAEAAAAGAELRFWNAWNEPNHPYFLSPQRPRCDVAARAESIDVYLELHQALGEALDAAPGEQERILGDLAGIDGSREDVVSVRDFIATLPRDVVCATRVWAQHAYLTRRNDARVARRALAAHSCPVPHEIWVTETGARNTERDQPPPARCASMNRRLRVWHADPRVTAAFQYTVREDDVFPYGLIHTGVDGAYPVLGLWQAWGHVARPSPGDPPPDPAAVCAPEPDVSGSGVTGSTGSG